MHYRNQNSEEFLQRMGAQQLRKYVADIVRVTREKFVRYGLTYFWIGALLAVPAVRFYSATARSACY